MPWWNKKRTQTTFKKDQTDDVKSKEIVEENTEPPKKRQRLSQNAPSKNNKQKLCASLTNEEDTKESFEPKFGTKHTLTQSQLVC